MAAEIVAQISADTTAFERGLAKATEQAKEFGKGLGEVGNDLAKNLSGIDVGKLIGIAGAATGVASLGVALLNVAKEFADALIDAAKEGYAEFEKYQAAILKMKYTLPAATPIEERGKVAAEREEIVESKVGTGGTLDQLNAAGLSLMQGSKDLRENTEEWSRALDVLKAYGIKSGITPDVTGDMLRKMADTWKEEGPKALERVFKALPGLEEQTEVIQQRQGAAYLKAQGLPEIGAGSLAQQAAYTKIMEAGPADVMTREMKGKSASEVIEQLLAMMEKSSKGIQAEAERERPEDKLKAEWEKVTKAFAETMVPAIHDFTRALTEAMPSIKESLVGLGRAFSPLISLVAGVVNVFGGIVAAVRFAAEAIGRGFAQIGAWLQAGLQPVLNFLQPAFKALGDVLAPLKPLFNELAVAVQGTINKMQDFFNPNAALDRAKAQAAQVDERIRQLGMEPKKILEAPEKEEPAKAPSPAEAPPLHRVTEEQVKLGLEADEINIKTAYAHKEAQEKMDFEATQAALAAQAKSAAKEAAAAIPSGLRGAPEKLAELEAAAAEKKINIEAAAAAKERTLDEEAALKINKIKEEMAIRQKERDVEDANATDDEKEARRALRAAQDNASWQEIDDINAAAAQKINDANVESTEKIIDMLEEAANKRAEIEYEAAVKAADAQYEAEMKGISEEKPPEPEKAPEGWKTFSHFGKRGEVIEGTADKEAREERNRQAREEFEARKQAQKDKAEADKDARIKAAADKKEQDEKAAKQAAADQAAQAAAQKAEVRAKYEELHPELKSELPPGKDIGPGAKGGRAGGYPRRRGKGDSGH